MLVAGVVVAVVATRGEGLTKVIVDLAVGPPLVVEGLREGVAVVVVVVVGRGRAVVLLVQVGVSWVVVVVVVVVVVRVLRHHSMLLQHVSHLGGYSITPADRYKTHLYNTVHT